MLAKIGLVVWVALTLAGNVWPRIRRYRQLKEMHLFRRLTDTGFATECGLEGTWGKKKQPKARHYKSEVTCPKCLNPYPVKSNWALFFFND